MNFLSNIWQSQKTNISSNTSSETTTTAKSQKFGTFFGVFVPTILMLFGVIIFLRLGFIVGQIGLMTSVFVITFAALIALVTALSMAAISTNIEVGKGGVYYMLSRSLGIEAGSAIGLPLFFKQSLTIAFCVIGFAESLNDLIPALSVKTIGIGTLGVLTVLAYASVKGALKVQLVIFIAIIASLISLFTGGTLEPMHSDTMTPAALPSTGFWAIFALFFPAMTGIESSVSLSGDLKNPSKSLPIGTISAIITAYCIYLGITLFLIHHVPLDRLVNDPLIMQDIASVPSLIIVGIWGATLSSALGGLLGAPRTLQAISDDGIVPKFLGKTFGSTKEPRIATLVTCAIAFIATYFGSINFIAPMLTMICLICYGVLNLSAGIETLMANPSWRPRFNVHWSISIAGAITCLITMLMIDPGYSMISLLLVAAIYMIVQKRQLQTSWEDIRHGILHFISRFAIYQMALGEKPLKSWRPHFLVFTKYSEEHSTSLMKFSEAISQSKSFLTMACFLPREGQIKQPALSNLSRSTFKNKNIQTFFHVKKADSITCGMKQMIENYGLGPLSPNTIVFGGIKKEDESSNFVEVLQTAIAKRCNVVIINDENNIQSKTPTNAEIHVWWDSANQNNSELMLVLASMLQKNPEWKKIRISAKVVISNEFEKQNMISEFEKITIEKRLPIDVETFVCSNFNETLNLVKEFSKDAVITLLSLKTPPQRNEPNTEYIAYLNEAAETLAHLPSLALVLSSEYTPLESILK